MLGKNLPSSELLWKIPARFCLDAISAWKGVFQGDFSFFYAIVKAHMSVMAIWTKQLFLKGHKGVVAPKKAEVAPDGFGDLGIVTNIAIKTIAGGEVIAPILSLGKGVAPEIKMGRKDIKVLPIKFEAAKMVASMTTDVRMTDDGQLVFRGARKGDMISYIDGVKMEGIQNVPSASLGYIMVYAGAIPAKYGDTTGGVVIMETLSYFDLLREWEARNE